MRADGRKRNAKFSGCGKTGILRMAALCAAVMLGVTACKSPGAAVDLDLTKLSSTMVYSEVFNIMMDPDEYIGKTIRMDGLFSVYHDSHTGNDYFACLIEDATACCAQGIEFVWEGEHTYPDDYPPVDSEIEVVGVFEKYTEDGADYYHVVNASMERL